MINLDKYKTPHPEKIFITFEQDTPGYNIITSLREDGININSLIEFLLKKVINYTEDNETKTM